MPRSAENRSTISNQAGEIVDPAGLDLGQVEQVVDHLGRVRAAEVWMKLDLLLLLVGQRAVEPVQQDPRDAADRAERRPELVAHVGQEAALQVGGLAQLVGVVVELGVQRDDALVGLGQLGRQRVDLAPRSRRRSPAAGRRERSQPSSMRPPAAALTTTMSRRRGRGEIAAQHAGDDRRMPLRAGPDRRPAASGC